MTALLSAKLKELKLLTLSVSIMQHRLPFSIPTQLDASWWGLEQVGVSCSTGLCLPSTRPVVFSLHFSSRLITLTKDIIVAVLFTAHEQLLWTASSHTRVNSGPTDQPRRWQCEKCLLRGSLKVLEAANDVTVSLVSTLYSYIIISLLKKKLKWAYQITSLSVFVCLCVPH
jgi:hypothetical protein